MFITVLIFIAVLAILVLSHEFGHFIVAKKAGMRVDEFGFGFPPRIASIKRGETKYSFNLFPIGGFVKIFGEDGEERGKPGSFTSKPIWVRSLVILAGVLANFFIAYILFSAGHVVGVPVLVSDDTNIQNIENISVQIVDLAPSSPAEMAGLRVGDKIIALSEENDVVHIVTVDQVQNFISSHQGSEVTFEIERKSQTLQLTAYVREDFPATEGATGIALIRTGTISYPWYKALIEGGKTFWLVTTSTFAAFGNLLKNMILSGSLPSDISGPVGIAYLTGTVVNLGFIHLLQFVALISLNLGIINLIPFPALDGGRLLFLIIEKIKGSPVPKRVEGMAHAIGFVLLILLIIAVTIKDINRFF